MSGDAIDASVTLDEVLAVVGSKRVPLAPELAGYLVLEIAEHADPAGGDIDAKSVFVGEEGTVALVKLKRERVSGDAETSVRTALGRLLEASGSQTPALAAASKRRNGGGLPALAGELHAALIPVNRAAGRRALARLAREVKRVMLGVGRHTLSATGPLGEPTGGRRLSPTGFAREEAPTSVRQPIEGDSANAGSHWSELPTTEFDPRPGAIPSSDAEVDSLIEKFSASAEGEQQHASALKALAGLDPTPPPPPEGPKPLAGLDPTPPPPPDLGARSASPFALDPGSDRSRDEIADRSGEADVEALLAVNESFAPERSRSRPRPNAAASRLVEPRIPRATGAHTPAERQLPTQPSHLNAARPTLPSMSTQSQGWAGTALVLLAIVVIAGGSYAMWRLRAFGGPRPSARDESVAVLHRITPVARCDGALWIADVPMRAEVLVHEGQAPVEISSMPVGARLEFVATAEGYAPKRVVVPAGAVWDRGPDGAPRFEAAVQLDPSRARAGSGDPWPAGEPGSSVGGEGPPGIVRVVATPRGAEVWMLAGIAPEARIEHVQCDHDFDVIVAGPATYRKRLHVATSDFVSESAPGAASSQRIARVSAK